MDELLERAVPGRTLAIGDIHGCDVALELLLEKLEPTADDRVIVLGDVVDRGPNTCRAIDLLLELEQTCELKFILGNHEEMMFEVLRDKGWLRGWRSVGGAETLEAYGGAIENIPLEHLDFLSRGLDYWEAENEIFVHANVEPDIPLDQQSADWLRWQKVCGDEPPHESGKRIVCGHSSQRSGIPLVFDGWVCIDTWVYGEGWLCCLDVGADLLYRATQGGDFSDGVPLDEFR